MQPKVAQEEDYEYEWVEDTKQKIEEVFPIIQNCFLIFSEQSICYYDIKAQKWEVGDFIEEDEEYEPVPQNSSLAHYFGRDMTTNLMVSGGIKKNIIQNYVRRIQLRGEFDENKKI